MRAVRAKSQLGTLAFYLRSTIAEVEDAQSCDWSVRKPGSGKENFR